MYRLRAREVWASEIAQYLNHELAGEDFLLRGPESLATPGFLGRLPDISDRQVLLLTNGPLPARGVAGHILTERPEVDLAYILLEFFSLSPIHQIHQKAEIDKEARIGRNVMVGPHSVIGPDVEVGDNTVILANVVLSGRVRIGRYCLVKDGAVIGSEGYGFVKDEAGVPLHPPHLGRVLLGDRVWVGANSTIERAMLEDTVVEEDVKIDDLVHLGAGSLVGKRSMLTAGVVVAYGVTLGEDVTLAPGSTVRERLTIGGGTTVGQGAVVVNDLPAGGVYVGNPARLLRQQ